MNIYRNAAQAIRDGNAQAPCGIGYKQDEGWFLYNLKDGMQEDNSVPEFLCLKQGQPPIALSDDATQVWFSLIKSVLC